MPVVVLDSSNKRLVKGVQRPLFLNVESLGEAEACHGWCKFGDNCATVILIVFTFDL